jgi:transcriptional regulator with XRE-family HTH domain
MRKSTHSGEYAGLRKRLAIIRSDAGLSQRQLAILLDVPHSLIAKIESGERRIDLVEFAWFCDACGKSAADEAARLLRKWVQPGRGKRVRSMGNRSPGRGKRA